jgi:hypothetical protein
VNPYKKKEKEKKNTHKTFLTYISELYKVTCLSLTNKSEKEGREFAKDYYMSKDRKMAPTSCKMSQISLYSSMQVLRCDRWENIRKIILNKIRLDDILFFSLKIIQQK